MPDWIKDLAGIAWGSVDIVLEIVAFVGVTLYVVNAPPKGASTQAL